MKNPHHWIWCNYMRFGQLSNLGVFEAFDLATIVQWSKKIIVDGRWAFEVGEKANFNIWTCWIQKKWMVKIAHTRSFTNKPKKKSKLFLLFCGILLRPSASQKPANFTSILEINFFSGYSSHIKYSFSPTNWRYMQKSCECTWPQWQNLSSPYGHTSKISKEISGQRGSSQLKARFGVQAQNTWGQLWAFLAFCWPQLTNKCYNIDVSVLINAGTLAPRVANWFPKFDGILFFQPWGQYEAIKFSIY